MVEVSVFVVLDLWRASHVQQGLYAGCMLPIGLCVWFSNTSLDHCGFTVSLRTMVLCHQVYSHSVVLATLVTLSAIPAYF